VRPIALACAVAALASSGAAVVVELHLQAWDTSSLVRMHDKLGIAKLAVQDDPTFKLRGESGFYDGAYFYAIARDPIATGRAHELLDEAPYYWGHPGYGWLAWLASGGGRPTAVPDALLAVGLLSIFAAGFVASLLARALGWTRGSTGWEGLFVAVNPGLVYSAVHDLAEPLSAALLLGGLLAYARAHRLAAAAAFGLLVFSKEQFLLVPLAVAAWELVRREARLRDVLPYAACLLPAAGWWIYARLRLGAWFTTGDNALAFPLSGWKRALVDAGTNTYSPDGVRSVSAEATLVVIAAILFLLAAAALLALRLRGPVEPVYLLLAIVAACLAPRATTLLRDALRNTSVLLTLVPFVIAAGAIRRGSVPAPES
jgi:hypothetical protein